MSRIGKNPIKIENGVTVEVKDGGDFAYKFVVVKGSKGELTQSIQRGIDVKVNDGFVEVIRDNDSARNRAYHGLYRTLIANMVYGVAHAYEKTLEIHGVGYRASLKGNDIELTLGLTHPISFKAPEGIKFEIKDSTEIKVTGIDKQLVGESAAKIRELKKPEPYKGKGIRYKGEYIRRKAGKTAGK